MTAERSTSPPTSASPSHSKASPTTGPQSLDQPVVIGDRVCINCGFNLFNQRVFREEHYQMMVVRCPECGTVASLQEYPILGKWAARWGRLAAAIWALLMMACVAGFGAINAGTANLLSFEMCKPFAIGLAEDYHAFYQIQTEGYKANSQANAYDDDEWLSTEFNATSKDQLADQNLDPVWFEDQGKDQTKARLASWRSRYQWPTLQAVLNIGFWLVVGGMFWAILMSYATIRKSVVVAIIVAFAGMGWVTLFFGFQ